MCLIPILLYSYCRICRLARFTGSHGFLCWEPPNYHSIGLSVRSPPPWAFIPAVGAEALEKIPPVGGAKKKRPGMRRLREWALFLNIFFEIYEADVDRYICHVLHITFKVLCLFIFAHSTLSILAHIYIIDNCRWIICNVDNMYMVKGICLIVAMCLSCHGLKDCKASPYRVSEHCGCALEHYSSTYVEQ